MPVFLTSKKGKTQMSPRKEMIFPSFEAQSTLKPVARSNNKIASLPASRILDGIGLVAICRRGPSGVSQNSALKAAVQFLSLFLLLFSSIQLSEARIVG